MTAAVFVDQTARRNMASYSCGVRFSPRQLAVFVVGALAMGAIGGWQTGAYWLVWSVVAHVGSQRFSGGLAKFWPIISAIVLAGFVLGLRAVA